MKPEIAIIARVGAHKALAAAGLQPHHTEVYSDAVWRQPSGALVPAGRD